MWAKRGFAVSTLFVVLTAGMAHSATVTFRVDGEVTFVERGYNGFLIKGIIPLVAFYPRAEVVDRFPAKASVSFKFSYDPQQPIGDDDDALVFRHVFHGEVDGPIRIGAEVISFDKISIVESFDGTLDAWTFMPGHVATYKPVLDWLTAGELHASAGERLPDEAAQEADRSNRLPGPTDTSVWGVDSDPGPIIPTVWDDLLQKYPNSNDGRSRLYLDANKVADMVDFKVTSLTAVPEPCSLVLAIGLGSWALMRSATARNNGSRQNAI